MIWKEFFIWRRLFKKRRRYGLLNTSIVPVISDYPDREKKAQEILQWLVDIRAVEPELSDCTLYMTDPGYAMGPRAGRLVKRPLRLPRGYTINGMEIVTERTVFDAGELGLREMLCPNCRHDAPFAFEMMIPFVRGEGSKAQCPECKAENELNDFLIHPPWAFSNLGFIFWNWENFKPGFLEQFEKRLGCEVKVIVRTIGTETEPPQYPKELKLR